MKPFRVFVGGKELIGYTSATLSRSKEEITGTLTLEIFMGYLPNEPLLADAVTGAQINIYVGSYLAFSGELDRREDSGTTMDVGRESYTLTISARGKTRRLVDTSHGEEKTLLNVTNKEVFTRLMQGTNVTLDWKAAETPISRFRPNDGGRVFDELQRICEMTALYMYETVDGKLKVVDKPGDTEGGDIVLGQNILSFNTNIFGDRQRKKIRVKGQRNDPKVWGEDAVLQRSREIEDASVRNPAQVDVQMSGDATDDLLEKRSDFEANRRSSNTRKINLSMFHLQQHNGQPWDIGGLHRISLPPAGIDGQFELTAIQYVVKATDDLYTDLTFSPKTESSASSSASGPAASRQRIRNAGSEAPPRRPDGLTAEWESPKTSVVSGSNVSVPRPNYSRVLESVSTEISVPDRLPPDFGPQ